MYAVLCVILQGNPDRLMYGSDYNGDTCGTGTRGKKVYYPRITEDIIEFAKTKNTNPLDVGPALLSTMASAAEMIRLSCYRVLRCRRSRCSAFAWQHALS